MTVGQDEDAMTITAVNFLNWAVALDDLLAETDTDYCARRDRDEDGQVLLAVRHVRDRHVHNTPPGRLGIIPKPGRG